MYFILTEAGQDYLAQNPVAPYLSSFQLGASYGYSPDPGQTIIYGPVLASGVPSRPFIESSNLLRYTIPLDLDVGPFDFGEVGLYDANGMLFALGVSSTQITKTATTDSQIGNVVTIDCYIPTGGTSLTAYASISNSASALSISRIGDIDLLPSATNTVPNLFAIPQPGNASLSAIAVAFDGRWTVSGYTTPVASGTVSVDNTGTTLTVTWTGSAPTQVYSHEFLIQFIDGPVAGYIRGVSSVTSTHVELYTALTSGVPAGTHFIIVANPSANDSASVLLAGLDPALTSADLNALIGVDFTTFVKRDGSTTLTGPLNANNHFLVNVPDPVNPQDVVNLRTLTNLTGTNSTVLTNLLNRISILESTALRKDGSVKLAGNLNAGSHKITAVQQATAGTEAINLDQLNAALAPIRALLGL